jgi:mono/diheme cytochrome c family protein
MRVSTVTRTCIAISFAFAAMAIAPLAQQGVDDHVSSGLTSASGQDSFNSHCAACHGRDAKGDGPVAAILKTKPTDLTTLARRNGGTFPRTDVISYIDGTGRALPSHGPGDMPVWGPIFRAMDTLDPRVKVRIADIAAYIETLQAYEPRRAP